MPSNAERNRRKHANRKARKEEEKARDTQRRLDEYHAAETRRESARKRAEEDLLARLHSHAQGTPLLLEASFCTTLALLDNWTPVVQGGEFFLQGNVSNDARFPDGSWIATSPLLSLNGECAKTSSGSYYKLGVPSKEYLEFRRNKGLGPVSDKCFCGGSW